MSTRGISAGAKPFPNAGTLKEIGQVASYLNELGNWCQANFAALNKSAKTIPYSPFDNLPPLAGPPRLIGIPNDPIYGECLAVNGGGTSGTATGWYRIIFAGTAGGSAASIPAGGTTSQVLGKNSTADFDMGWQTPHYVPAGGTTGQALRKTGTADYAEAWADVHEVIAGGTTGQVLAKTGTADYATAWTTLYGVPAGGTDKQILVKSGTGDGTSSWGLAVGTLTADAFISLGQVTAGGTSSYAVFSSTAAYLGKSLQLAGQTSTATIGTAGTASALPANPAAYMRVIVNGGTFALPLYNP